MVDPFRNMYDDIHILIDDMQYFLIHAPRQTGKTTFLHALAHRLNKEGNYVAVVCSLESAGSRKKDFDNPFRLMMYENEQEMEAVLGSIEKDSFNKNKMTEWDQLKHQVSLLVDELDKLSRVI